MYDKKEICKDMNFITKRNRDIQKRGEQGWVQEYMFASKYVLASIREYYKIECE